MVESTEMGAETARLDNVLDHLAQGEVYAEQGTMAMYAADIREVPDAAVSYDPGLSGQRQQIGTVTARFRRERYRGAMYVPKMQVVDKIMSMTVLALLACFGVFAALAAYNMLHLTQGIRMSYADQGLGIVQQPVPMHILLDQELFAQTLSEFPDQAVYLYMKRTRACREKKLWVQAVRSFEEAALHSVHAIAMNDHLDYVDSLVHAGYTDRAMKHLESLKRDSMSDRERTDAMALLGRLHFALMP